ncbi:ABC transporter permease [Microbacterium sp. CFH 90308]|uniref:ABC transporter permease n=1 Tax=Microbacterium salsuginis TaxID=2722803 RepID=A0ABX1K5Q8_9MICO|nr:ABC transporter permease [Microbacterium sp. CFH 90308]NLP82334.1 ABC transporter permease [Microbacterium sp. CFH 90308]
MYTTYLRRELSGRKKQTIIVAAGLAVAIALVMIVNSLAAGVREAQAHALESVYGVGTDLTVTGAQADPGEMRAQTFEFGADGGQTGEDGTTELSQSRLMTEPMRSTLDASTLGAVTGVDGVAEASGALSLTNMTFSGELPQPPGDGTQGAAPEGEAQGGEVTRFGGGAFDVDSFTVLGIDASGAEAGPLSSVEVSDGRGLAVSDEGEYAAVLDAAYAASAELAVGDALEIGGAEFQIVGLVTSTTDEADTAANVYIPLDVAQELSGAGDVISTVYVHAESADAIAQVQAALEEELPDAVVSSQSDLAASVSGSLSSASALITNLGTWLSLIVLAVALALAVLFTLSGVSRRTREFGTLKAIGWSNGRVVSQVAGESVVQGLIGGAAGLAIGFAGIWAINLISPTVSTAPAADGPTRAGPAGGLVGPASELGGTAQGADIVLQAPVTVWVVAAAVGIAVIGGLIAGAFGGWRAARLSPAEALRAVG